MLTGVAPTGLMQFGGPAVRVAGSGEILLTSMIGMELKMVMT